MNASPSAGDPPDVSSGPMPELTRSDVNPAQRTVVERLRGDRSARPTYDAEMRHELRAALEGRLAEPVAELPADVDLWLSKRTLELVHGCEARWLAEEASSSFSWSIPVARGKVAHKAIELSVNWRRELLPGTLADEALARLEQGDDDFARWLQALGEAERAELLSSAGALVAAFLECWPQLPRSWRPVLEQSLRQDLLGGRVHLHGRPDLTLGTATGLVAGKAIVDFKTGRVSRHHVDDLRFYALIDTLRVGTPPLRLATSYLDSGELHVEDLREATLWSTVERCVDAVEKMVVLRLGRREARRVPSAACAWCPATSSCPPGRQYLDERAGRSEHADADDDAW